MTAKRLFVGRKTCEDRFTIINDYDGEIGVKENRSGDVLVLKHSDLNAQQFVAQLVVFLNDQNQAIVDLYDGSKYWSDKATEKIKELEKENEQLHEENQKLALQLRMLEQVKPIRKIPESIDVMIKADSNLNEVLFDELEKVKKENKQIKDLIHTMLNQIDVENITSDSAIYSARIFFSRNEFNLISELWKRS